jgi:hypothetical protein
MKAGTLWNFNELNFWEHYGFLEHLKCLFTLVSANDTLN